MNQWFIRIFLGTERTGRGRRFGVGEGLRDESPARIWHKELWTCTKIRRAQNWRSLISFLLSRGGCLPIFQNCPLLSNESVFWDTIEFKFHHMRPILRRRSLSFFLSPTQPNSSFFIPRMGFNRLQKWKWIIPPETLIGGFGPFTLKVWLISLRQSAENLCVTDLPEMTLCSLFINLTCEKTQTQMGTRDDYNVNS